MSSQKGQVLERAERQHWLECSHHLSMSWSLHEHDGHRGWGVRSTLWNIFHLILSRLTIDSMAQAIQSQTNFLQWKIFQSVILVVKKMKQIDPGGYKRKGGEGVTIVNILTKAMFIFLLFVPVCFCQTRERVQFRISGKREFQYLWTLRHCCSCSNDPKFYPFIKT